MRTLKDQHGFHFLEAIIVVAVFCAISLIGWKVYTRQPDEASATKMQSGVPSAVETVPTFNTAAFPKSPWDVNGEGDWHALDTIAPACPEPFMLAAPADLSLATAILMPGQYRRGSFSGQGGNYKPHGGFRFDTSKPGEIKVYSPIDGYVTRGSRFLVDGEIQYTFDIVHPCGYMARLGHLRKLTDAFEEIVETLPAAKEGDSRTERVEPAKLIKAGEQIANAAGLELSSNSFFDMGIYDLRQKNAAAESLAFQKAHADAKDTAWYGVCWLEMFSDSNAELVKKLPAGDTDSGAKSDYCT